MRRQRRVDEWQNHPQPDYEQPGLVLASPPSHDHHEHGSDPDETDDESMLPRVRSFGDAEDFLNSIQNAGIGYESFVLPSPLPSNAVLSSEVNNPNNSNNSLHHRSRHVTTTSTPMNHKNGVRGANGSCSAGSGSNNLDDDESPRHRLLRQLPTLNNQHHYTSSPTNKRLWMSPISKAHLSHLHSHVHSQHSSWKSSYTLVRWCFLIGFASYLVLLSRSTYYLGQHQDQVSSSSSLSDKPLKLQLHQQQQRYFANGGSKNMNLYRSSAYASTSSASKWFEQRLVQVQDEQSRRQTRAEGRRQRVTPSTTTMASFNLSLSQWHDLATLDEPRQYLQLQQEISEAKVAPPSSSSLISEISKTATLDQLCGFQAQNASLTHPQFYPVRAALNSQSRVLITGILNPVGFSLALYLKEKCGVQQIAGVDAMYPNTVYNRLLLQERIQLLMTNIPKLVKPLLLPYIGLDPRTKSNTGTSTNVDSPSSSSTTTASTLIGEEMNYMEGFEPTHIVHLASYSMDALYNHALVDPLWKNTHSPYVADQEDAQGADSNGEDPFFYPLRSSMIAMEQLLESIVSVPPEGRPQMIYATKTPTSNKTTKPKTALSSAIVKHTRLSTKKFESITSTLLINTIKHMDEILVDTYHAQYDFQVPTIGLRLPNTIYGPWGQAGSIVHDMMERAVEQQESNVNITTQSARNNGSILPSYSSPARLLDMLYVDDAVEAIVSAMQYRTESPVTLNVPAAITTSVVSAASAIQSYLSAGTSRSPIKKENPFFERLLEQDRARQQQQAKMDFSADKGNTANSIILPTQRTALRDGLLRSIAWHLDRLSPYGPPAVETGDEFLQRHHEATCAHDDVTCHKSSSYVPCSSECNIRDQCLPSIFDPVRELVYNVSDGCDIVMYTQSLGYNVKDIDLHAEYMDDKDLDDDELLVCNFAFIPRESELVKTVSDKVPNDQLAKFGIKPQASDASSKAMLERKLDGLNGRLLYRGWILIWVKEGIRPLTVADRSLLKLSPSAFFHPGVRYGLFVEENFSVSPNLEDVLFLVDEMKRRQLPDRTIKKEEKIDTPHGVISKKVKYRIPKEPPRRAAILFAPLRYPNIDDPIINEYRNGHRKLSVYDATKFMRYEVGYDHGEKEPAEVRRQREYYERIPSYINKNTELRSNYEPWYRFSMRHWVRTRWVVHDFKLEDSRLLRCDWYQEHIQWGNDLDQLSFANVMATRELKRRMAHQEPDDHVKTFIEEHPELHDLTDSYEWHALETDINKLHREPTDWQSQLPEHIQVMIDATGKVEIAEDEVELSDDETPLYVRIMSERVMAASRKIWSKIRKQILKAKQTGHQSNPK